MDHTSGFECTYLFLSVREYQAKTRAEIFLLNRPPLQTSFTANENPNGSIVEDTNSLSTLNEDDTRHEVWTSGNLGCGNSSTIMVNLKEVLTKNLVFYSKL